MQGTLKSDLARLKDYLFERRQFLELTATLISIIAAIITIGARYEVFSVQGVIEPAQETIQVAAASIWGTILAITLIITSYLFAKKRGWI